MKLSPPLHKVWIWGPVFSYLGLVFYLSSLSRIPWSAPYPDYVGHAVEYMGLAMLMARAFNGGLLRPVHPRLLLITLLLCTLYAISDELHQVFVANRFADVMDVVADTVGAALGLIGLHFGQRALLRRGVSSTAGGGPVAILYTRKGCPLCFTLKRSASRASRRNGIPLRVVDITEDPSLSSRYGLMVPVLELAGVPAVHGRVAPLEVEEMFQRVAATRTPGGGGGAGRKRRVSSLMAVSMRRILSAIGIGGRAKA